VSPGAAPGDVWVVGAGLMGTSLALALRQAGWPVWLSDRDERAQRLGAQVSGAQEGRAEHPTLTFLAVPPQAAVAVLSDVDRLTSQGTVSDLLSVKANLQREVESFPQLSGRFVGGHPVAGRERSGPDGARGDLFRGRPWVLTAQPEVAPWRLGHVVAAVRATGAVPVVWGAQPHDDAMAAVSHVPQVVASALAAGLLSEPPEVVELAGSGVRDTARIAGSDPTLWRAIVGANAGPVGERLRAVADELGAVAAELTASAEWRSADTSTYRSEDSPGSGAGADPVADLLLRGREGYHRIPGKHGEVAVEYAVVPVVIPDEPGALARLFAAAGDAGVNVEDVSIEHSPGQPVGLVELSVEPAAAEVLRGGLARAGWSVH
jgi:prephenate dehydrogenase